MNRLIRLPDHCLRLCSIKMTVAVLSVYPVNKKYSIHILFNKKQSAMESVNKGCGKNVSQTVLVQFR